MPIRHFADINQTSDSFGGGTNAGMNRHEEFRQERNREFHSQPRRNPNEAAEQALRDYKINAAADIRSQRLNATSLAGTPVHFDKRVLVLPPVRRQKLDQIGDVGEIDGHFGGLGLQQHMYDLFLQTIDNTVKSNREISQSNAASAKKKTFRFLGKKEPQAVAPRSIVPIQLIIDDFNKGLAAARIPIFIAYENGLNYAYHPSSQSGDPVRELEDWKNTHWQGTSSRSWDSFLLERIATSRAS